MSNAKVDGEAAAGPADKISRPIRTSAAAAQPQPLPAQEGASAPDTPPPERDSDTLAPLAPDAPYVYGNLDDKTFHSTLSGFVEQAQGQYAEFGLTLYCRILPGLKDAQRRFAEHENDAQYRLDGCSGIEEYIEKLGLKPARVRKWRQRDKERQFMRELKLLSGIKICQDCGQEKDHAPSCPHYERHLTETQSGVVKALVAQGYKPKDALLMVKSAEGQDFESLFRSALAPAANRRATGMTMGREEKPDAQVGPEDNELDGPGVVVSNPETHLHPPSHEPLLDLVPEPEPGSKERIGPPPALPASAPVSQAATYEDWKSHQLPAPNYKLKYFEEASENFKDRYLYAFQGSAFKKILDLLRDRPEQVLSNPEDFAQLAVVVRSAAENLNLLAAAITTGLTPPAPAPEPGR